MKNTLLIGALLMIVQVTSVRSQQVTLSVGSKAPQLYIQEWIKGKPVKKFESGKYYLVELSGVGCTPCRLQIPHLSELAKKYRGKLEIISIYTTESNLEDPKDLRYIQGIKKFINSMSDKIAYSVAIDVPQQYTFEKWGKAAGMNGVPAAFLVNGTGQIVWFGFVGSSIDEILATAVSGNSIEALLLAKQQASSAQTIKRIRSELPRLIQAAEIKIAIEKMDSLIAMQPDDVYYRQGKFQLLAGVDNDKAYECLAWILKNRDVKGHDWFHLIYYTYAHADKPEQFAMAHEVADRAITQGGPTVIIVEAMLEKARIFMKQNDFQSAVACGIKALEITKKDSPVDPDYLQHVENNLASFKEELQMQKSKT